jgi:hypothetical protein
VEVYVLVGVNVTVGVSVIVLVRVIVGVGVMVAVDAVPRFENNTFCGMISLAWLELDQLNLATAPPPFS